MIHNDSATIHYDPASMQNGPATMQKDAGGMQNDPAMMQKIVCGAFSLFLHKKMGLGGAGADLCLVLYGVGVILLIAGIMLGYIALIKFKVTGEYGVFY